MMNEKELYDSLTKIKAMMASKKNMFFLVSEAFTHEMEFSDKIPPYSIAGTDGKKILFRPESWDKLTKSNRIRVIAHETMHIMFQHHARADNRYSPKINNIAMDIPIEAIATNCDLGDRIEGTVPIDYNGNCNIKINGISFSFPKAYEWTYEDIMAEIIKKIPPDDNDKNESNGGDKSKDDPDITDSYGTPISPVDDFNPENITEQDVKKIQSRLRRMAMEEHLRGTLPDSLKHVIDGIFETKTDWRNELRQFINPEIKSFLSYNRVNRRFHDIGYVMPGVKKEGLTVTIAIDTSGSISEDEIRLFKGEISRIFSQFEQGSVNATLLFHNTKVYYECSLKSKSKINESFRLQSGGTSHSDVFRIAEKKGTEILICLTDGYSNLDTIGKSKIKKVIFLLTTKDNIDRIPFGKKIVSKLGG